MVNQKRGILGSEERHRDIAYPDAINCCRNLISILPTVWVAEIIYIKRSISQGGLKVVQWFQMNLMTKKLDVKEDAVDINTAKVWCPDGENFQYMKVCEAHC